MNRLYVRISRLLLFVSVAALCSVVLGQTPSPQNPDSTKQKTKKKTPRTDDESHPASDSPGPALKNLLRDQRDIWTSPFKARVEDMKWLVPMIGLSAGLISADAELSRRVNVTGTLGKHSGTVSNVGLAVALGGPGLMWLAGRVRSDDHQKETGILGLEAATNALIVTETLKFVTQRERPNDGTGQGRFWQSTSLSNSSFPSTHAMITWSVASVVAHEYPGIATQVLSYGLATGVSLSRVYGKDHFPSDVVVGSLMGWLIGQHIYAAHHDLTLPGGGWGTFHHDSTENAPPTDSQFSPYVPIDSWVYPAFERLFSLGAIPSGFLGIRPWTRHECARLLDEVDTSDDAPDEVTRLYAALAKEFAPELQGDTANYIGLDSIYARAMSISGPPLTDGYHFNKTIAYDYGRPYERGMNYITGFSSSAAAGPIGFYVRGEFDHAPSAPGVSQSVQDAIQVADGKVISGPSGLVPIHQPATPIAAFDRPQAIEAYVSLNIKGWQASFGKQSLWTGPTRDPFMFTNNAEPLWMFRIDQTSPRKLPGFLSFLGPYRIQLFFGKVTGQHYVNPPTGPTVFSIGRSLDDQPLIHGQQISFKPTPNFEFGVGVTTLWGGVGVPITLSEVKRTFFTFTNPTTAGSLDPGDRRSFFNWSYRIPYLRKWLMIYQDSFTEDEFSPIGYPRRAAQNPGLYMPQIPLLPHLDFRFEGGYTALPNLIQPAGGGFFYWNVGYLDGYTNKGNIIGNTIGREGISLRAATTYWIASDKNIQFSYRSEQTDTEFLQGGNLRDFEVHSEWRLRPSLSLTSMLQYEYWNFPVLTQGKKQTNFTASFQLTYWPHWRLGNGQSRPHDTTQQ